jgi:NAD(P)-dependent dehydrogenase (short-subunit alcohol dehydrogenase family)
VLVAITGRLDTVVASAGMAFAGNIMDITEEQWSRLMRVNLDGTFYTARFTMPHLLRSMVYSIDGGSTAGYFFSN